MINQGVKLLSIYDPIVLFLPLSASLMALQPNSRPNNNSQSFSTYDPTGLVLLLLALLAALKQP